MQRYNSPMGYMKKSNTGEFVKYDDYAEVKKANKDLQFLLDTERKNNKNESVY